MTKAELERLAEQYQHKADTAYQNYQETGVTRYNAVRRKSEDMADALRMAANAAEDHAKLIHLRGALSQLAGKADRIAWAPEEQKDALTREVIGGLLVTARMEGLINDTRGRTE